MLSYILTPRNMSLFDIVFVKVIELTAIKDSVIYNRDINHVCSVINGTDCTHAHSIQYNIAFQQVQYARWKLISLRCFNFSFMFMYVGPQCWHYWSIDLYIGTTIPYKQLHAGVVRLLGILWDTIILKEQLMICRSILCNFFIEIRLYPLWRATH